MDQEDPVLMDQDDLEDKDKVNTDEDAARLEEAWPDMGQASSLWVHVKA